MGLVIQYLLLHVSPGEDQPRTNPVDALLLGTLRGPVRSLGIKLSWLNTPPQEGKWRSAFDRVSDIVQHQIPDLFLLTNLYQCILSVGDIQLAMGFAALVYAYVTSFTDGMSVYHWWVVVGLV